MSLKEIKSIPSLDQSVRSLRLKRSDETDKELLFLHRSTFTVLNFMEKADLLWTPEMSELLTDINGMKPIFNYCVQNDNFELKN